MPRLLDLFRLNADAVNQTPARLRNLPAPPPAEPEWDIRSGKPEPGLGQVTPEEWLPPGAGMKLAALAKGLAGKAAIAGTFIGPRHSSWMKDAAEEALQLKAQGVDPREIWARTRVFTEHPGVEAVQEISDARPYIDLNAMNKVEGFPVPGFRATPKGDIPAYDLYPYDNLYRGYPELARARTNAQVETGISSYGSFLPGSYTDHELKLRAAGPMSLKGVMTHELQHGVQQAEGWPLGGNAASMFSDPQTRDYAMNLAKELESVGHSPADAYKKASYETYRRLAGEAQAEAARARMNFSDSRLTQNYPGDSYPVPLKDLLIRR